jgi:hypothetical protein
VIHTLFEAIAPVVIVIIVFLQTWRFADSPDCRTGVDSRDILADACVRFLDQRAVALRDGADENQPVGSHATTGTPSVQPTVPKTAPQD